MRIKMLLTAELKRTPDDIYSFLILHESRQISTRNLSTFLYDFAFGIGLAQATSLPQHHKDVELNQWF